MSERIFAHDNDKRKFLEQSEWKRILASEIEHVVEQPLQEHNDDDGDSDEWSEHRTSTSSSESEVDNQFFFENIRNDVQLRQKKLADISNLHETIKKSKLDLHSAAQSEHRRSHDYLETSIFHNSSAAHVLDDKSIIRELCRTLAGHPYSLFLVNPDTKKLTFSGKILSAHNSESAFASIVTSFAEVFDKLTELRCFVQKYTTGGEARLHHQDISHCLGALATELDCVLRERECQWIQWEEQHIAGPYAVYNQEFSSLLQFEKKLDEQIRGLLSIYCVLDSIGLIKTNQEEVTVASILDALYYAHKLQSLTEDQEQKDVTVSRCLVATMRPVWNEINRWIVWGGANRRIWEQIGNDDSFFASRDLTIHIYDPYFWSQGFVLKGRHTFPAFMQSTADDIVSAGKSVFLLRAMGQDNLVTGVDMSEFSASENLGKLVNDQSKATCAYEDTSARIRRRLFNRPGNKANCTDATCHEDPTPLHSWNALGEKLHTNSMLLRKKLSDQLILPRSEGGFDLFGHLIVIQDLFLWRRGYDLGIWCDQVFEYYFRNKIFPDQHFLNRTFREDTRAFSWVNLDLIRIRVKSDRIRNNFLDELRSIRFDYSIPWPLNYMFTPHVMDIYQAISTFLLQLQYTKHALTRLVVRPREMGKEEIEIGLATASMESNTTFAAIPTARYLLHALQQDTSESRRFYAFKRRCHVLLDALSVHVRRHIVELLSTELEDKMQEAVGFDSIMELHTTFLENIAQLLFIVPSSRSHSSSTIHTLLANSRKSVEAILDLIASTADVIESYRDLLGHSRAPKSNRRSHVSGQTHLDRMEWGRKPKSRKATRLDEMLHGSDAEDDDEQEANERNAEDYLASELKMLQLSHSTSTFHSINVTGTPQEDSAQWLITLEHRLSSCQHHLIRDVSRLVQCSSSSKNYQARDLFSLFLETLQVDTF